MSSPKPFSSNPQVPFIHSRDNPYFDGLLRNQDSHVRNDSMNIFRSVADIVDSDTRLKKPVSGIHKEVMDIPLEDSAMSGFTFASSARSSPERWLSKNSKTSSFVQPDNQSDFIDLCNPKDQENDFTANASEAVEDYHILEESERPIVEKKFIISKRKEMLPTIPLPRSAASYYDGYSPEIEITESCESISKLNAYLRAKRNDVNAGVPGRFLHAVMSSEDADVGTIASTIMYAFYLDITLNNNKLCTVPIINMKRVNLGSHAELKWLLDSCQIDQSSLVFADEIDLSYYDLYGSLKIVLLNSRQTASKQESEELKKAVVEIFCCRRGETVYPWVKDVTMAEDHSCCTAIADKFAQYSPELLASKGFSRLLLAGILLDTGNLADPHCTSKDKYMASLLINGAGRYGCSGLYQLLKYKMHDVSNLRVTDILRKDFRKWTGVGSRSESQIGMSCITISIGKLLAQMKDFAQEIKNFRYAEKVRVLIIVSGYYNAEKNFKREILVAAESVKLLKSLLFFFDFNASQLPLKEMNQPGLKNEMEVFEIDKITSRKTIERLIEEFVGIPKA